MGGLRVDSSNDMIMMERCPGVEGFVADLVV